ncbi:14 kDa fatty acid-binding protein-like [Daphnia pulicaria]|uniref:14 kDa fatty acid-binding protein-like n=1 Tax=Daphnia pulicaria TaxID=35523 RepID=UPI001EE9B990|nr:14 kDa fatty acid-binding protein-like [Daphnia pulicaria]
MDDNNQHEHQQKQTDFMAQVVGKYRLVGQVNYEEFLRAIGLSMAKRAIAISQVPLVDCRIDDDGQWIVQVTGISKDSDFKFRLGVEMKRVTIDGRHVNDLFTVEEEGGKMKLIQKEIWGNNRSCEAVMVHEFDGDDWNMTMTFGDVTCVRHFRRE